MYQMMKDAAVRDSAHKQFPFCGVLLEQYKQLWCCFDPLSTKIDLEKSSSYFKHMFYIDKKNHGHNSLFSDNLLANRFNRKTHLQIFWE